MQRFSTNLLFFSITALIASAFAEATTIPFTLNAAHRVAIPCSYGGLKGVCGFDSGARMNNVGFNSATKPLPSKGQDVSEGAAGTQESCDIVNLQSWSLGSFTVKNPAADRCGHPTDTDVVGIGFFAGHSFSFDMSKAQIVTDSLPPKGQAQPMDVHPLGWALLPISVAGSQAFQGLWDTGADVSMIDEKLVAENPDAFSLIGTKQVTDSTGRPIVAKLYSVFGVKIGDLDVTDFTVLAGDFTPEMSVMGSSVRMILGRNILQLFKWYIDIPNKSFALVPSNPAATDQARWPDMFGLTEIVKVDGSMAIEVHSMDDVKLSWADVDPLIARMTSQKDAVATPEYISYREGATAFLGPAVYASDPDADYDSLTKIKSTPDNPWLTMVQPKTQAETNCLSMAVINGKLQGCGDIFQNGITDDKLACFMGKTYPLCHLECMDSVNQITLNFTPGRCSASTSGMKAEVAFGTPNAEVAEAPALPQPQAQPKTLSGSTARISSPVTMKTATQTWTNPDCAKGGCDIRSATLTTYPQESGTAMVASFTTAKATDLGNYVFVQFIRGCAFMENSQGQKKLVTQDQYWGVAGVPFDHKDWQMDEGEKDPVYWGVPGGFDPLRQRDIPRDGGYLTANPITSTSPDTWYGSVLNIKTPTLYVADQPTSGSIEGNQAGVPSLQFQTCLYRAQDVPAQLSAPDQAIPNALHCFSWQSNYSFDWKTQRYSPADAIDPFCGVKN